MTDRPSPEALDAAIEQAGRVVADLLEEHPDRDRAAFVLVSAVQILHAYGGPDGRHSIETRIRHLLAAMYVTPPAAMLIANGAEFRINKDPR